MEECECCCRKFTTLGCIGCRINSIKRIKEKIENMSIKEAINSKFTINRIYARDILENIDFNGFDYVITNNIDEDEMLLIVRKNSLKV